MSTVPPWHSLLQTVYHDQTQCEFGNKVDFDYVVLGTGSRRLCTECRKLKWRHLLRPYSAASTMRRAS